MAAARTRCIPLIAVALAAVWAPAAWADIGPHHDLDELTFLASEIVEATVVGFYDGDKDFQPGAELRVDAVYAGDLKKDATIKVFGLSGYRKDIENQKPWAKGDRAWLFLETLATARGNPKGVLPGEEHMFVPVLSGVRLVEGGNVLTPHQWGKVPYVFVVPDENAPLPTAAAFSKTVDECAERIAGLRAKLAQPVGTTDEGWVLRLLKQRSESKERYPGWDPVSRALRIRLGAAHDLTLLQEAMELPNLPTDEMVFGFGSPQGRDMLVKKLADEQVAADIKLRYIEAVRMTGSIYGWNAVPKFKDRDVTWTWEGADTPGNGKYLERLAELATSKKLDKAVAEKLRETIQQAGLAGFGKFDAAKEDSSKANLLLQEKR